jgi:hypothetical protein
MKLSPSMFNLGALRHTPANQRWMSVRPVILQSGILPTRKSMQPMVEPSYNSNMRIQNPRGKK